jgi:hypothetical protein
MPGAPETVARQPGHCGFCHGSQYSQRIDEDEDDEEDDEVDDGDFDNNDICESFVFEKVSCLFFDFFFFF